MGKGNRGFKPQGIVNPLLMARGRTVPSGPTILERLNRSSRPTWDDLKKIAQKKEKTSSDFLEEWENRQYKEQIAKFRESKREHQEKCQLEILRGEAKSLKRSMMEAPKPAGSGEPTDATGRERKRRTQKRRRQSPSSAGSSELSTSSLSSSTSSSSDKSVSSSKSPGSTRKRQNQSASKSTRKKIQRHSKKSSRRLREDVRPLSDNPHRLSTFFQKMRPNENR